MRRPFIAGNWKMNTTLEEAITLVEEMRNGLNAINSTDRVLCPPFISLYSIAELIKGTSIELGAQNMYFKDKGAFTGEISPMMLKPMCKYVILGHSERRKILGETDTIVNVKVKAALFAGLLPILCIGETLEENDTGRTQSILESQINAGLKDIDANKGLIIAYEPIWAIGTGKASTGRQAGITIRFIRYILAAVWGTDAAESIRILYGGSVTASNIVEFLREPAIDGALVGGASLKAAEFVEIVRLGAAAKSIT